MPTFQNTTDKIHQSHWYRIRDLPWSNFEIFLQVNRRQFRCRSCGKVFSEELSFVKKRRTYTKRLATKVVKEVLETDIVNTARRNGMTPAEIETLLKEAEEEFLTEKPRNLKKLGIDEITHLKGGKNYAAVLVDLEKRKPIAFLERRNKEVENVAPELMRMYKIKEELRKIFESEITADEALWKFVKWLKLAYKDFPKSCQTIRRWLEEILTYFDNRTTQGVVEGINQKVKLIKRRAFGFVNFDNFKRRMLLNWHFCC